MLRDTSSHCARAVCAATVLAALWGLAAHPATAAPAGATAAAPANKPMTLGEMEDAMFQTVNEVRMQRGFQPLRLSPEAVACARDHSGDMARFSYFEHRDSAGRGAADRLTDKNVPWVKCAENVGVIEGADRPVPEVVKAWLESPSHVTHLLDPNLEETGIGAACSADGRFFFTQVFVTR